GYWPDHSYNYTADFESTFRYDFSCNINFEKYYPAEVIHHRAVGVYVFNDDGTGNDEDAIRANCQQYTDNGQPWWGQPYFPNEGNQRCRFEGIRSTTRMSSSHPVDASACTERRSTYRPSSPDSASASRKSTRASGSSASCITTWDISTWSRKPCKPSTTRSARGCNLCLRYETSPMCPGWTFRILSAKHGNELSSVCRPQR